jgi:hypothetical protein
MLVFAVLLMIASGLVAISSRPPVAVKVRARDFDPASQAPVLASALVREPGKDEELATRQSALQAAATALLDELDQSRVSDHRPYGGDR